MTINRVFSDPFPTFYLANGTSVNSNGKLYFYEPGSGSVTPKSVYSDAALTTALKNPVILDSTGKPTTPIFMNGDYKVVEATSSGTTIRSTNNYNTTGFDSQFAAWSSVYSYSLNDVVKYNGSFYLSIQNNNMGNTPGTTAYWTKIYNVKVYNSNETYSAGDIVYSGGKFYSSLQNNNKGRNPSSSPTFWDDASQPDDITTDTITTTGDITSGNDIVVTNDLSVSNNLSVTNDATVTNDLDVQGSTTLASLSIAGDPFDFEEPALYSASFSGFSGSVSASISYIRIGDYYYVSMPATQGTSNATSFTIDLGAEFQKGSGFTYATSSFLVKDNGTISIGYGLISGSSGVMTVYRMVSGSPSSTFTASGTKGVSTASGTATDAYIHFTVYAR